MMSPVNKGNLYIIVGFLLMTTCAVFMGCFGLIFTNILNKMLVVDPEGKMFKNFDSPSVPIYMDFYIFNVTNPAEVQYYGAKPKLVELGPYSYLEKMQKHNYTWNDTEGTVTYMQDKTYFFDEERSKGNLSDQVTTLNSVMVIVAALTFQSKIITEFIWPEIEGGMDLFQTITVDEMLFLGFELPEFDFRMPFWSKTENLTGTIYDILTELGLEENATLLEPNRFGYYFGKNGSDNGLFKVKTGAQGMQDYLHIQEWNNADSLPYWDDPYCNMINGTDGTQYPPGVHRDTTIRLFSTDMCRSIYLSYNKDTVVNNIITTYNYLAPPKMLESPNTNPDNACFCTILPGEDDCLDDGMMNMQNCLHAPIVLSTPHFYQGDPEEVDKVDGLNPQKELHETYLDIEPTTGVVMEAAKKIQLNLPLKRYGNLPSFMNVPELIFPVLWASENAQIPKDNARSLKNVLTIPYIVVYVLCAVLIVFGFVLLGSGIIKIRRAKNARKGASLIKK